MESSRRRIERGPEAHRRRRTRRQMYQEEKEDNQKQCTVAENTIGQLFLMDSFHICKKRTRIIQESVRNPPFPPFLHAFLLPFSLLSCSFPPFRVLSCLLHLRASSERSRHSRAAEGLGCWCDSIPISLLCCCIPTPPPCCWASLRVGAVPFVCFFLPHRPCLGSRAAGGFPAAPASAARFSCFSRPFLLLSAWKPQIRAPRRGVGLVSSFGAFVLLLERRQGTAAQGVRRRAA